MPGDISRPELCRGWPVRSMLDSRAATLAFDLTVHESCGKSGRTHVEQLAHGNLAKFPTYMP